MDKERSAKWRSEVERKEDLIYCIDQNNTHFRYSQSQRRRETGKKIKRNKLLKMKQGTNITEIENGLSECNSKNSNYDDFLEYLIKKKNKFSELSDFYSKSFFCQSRWRSNILTQKSESKMINNFKKKFGNPEEVIIAIGDWEQKQQMKFKEPTIGKGIRKIFRKNHYDVYLVDEFRTSCICCKCQRNDSRNEKFLKRKDPRPWKKNQEELKLVHGLLKCQTCRGYWNRDVNGAINIRTMAEKAISGEDRLIAFQR